MTGTAAPILVTGATGRVGGTGRHVAAELVRRGRLVRALVRRLDDRSKALQDNGVDVVVGDFTDYGSLLAALDGVESTYFTHPVGAGMADGAGLFAAAGRERTLRHVVDLSLDAAFPRSHSPQGRAAWVTERIFEWAGYGGTHLRVAAFFMENLLGLYGSRIRESGMLRNSFGDHEPAWIAAADVGAVAAAMLAAPASTAERTTVVGGTERASHRTIASIIGGVTGHPVRYERLEPDAWRAELVADAAAAGRHDTTAAAHLSAQSVALRADDTHLVSDAVQRTTGRPPISLTDFLTANQAVFTPDPSSSNATS